MRVRAVSINNRRGKIGGGLFDGALLLDVFPKACHVEGMQIFANIMVGIVALQHVYILVLEMFLWQKPAGRKTFRMTPEQAKETAVLAANQGLYNGFLAVGLFWTLVYPSDYFAHQLALFFLGCVFIAACYGGYSVGRKILFVQGGPALVGLIATLCWSP